MIAIIGDAFVDRYHLGYVRGLSAEAPIPIVDIGGVKEFAGGAANVQANLTAMGAQTVLINSKQPTLGSDRWRVPIKNRLMAGDTQLARWDTEDWLPPIQVEELLPVVDADAVIVCDYGKGSITPDLIEVLKLCEVPLFVDTKANPKDWIGANDCTLFPNLKEYSQFKETYDWLPQVVLKQGADGATILQYGRPVHKEVAKGGKVRSVNGAGDTVIAAYTDWIVGAGGSPAEALRWSMAAAAAAVSKPYTSTVTLEEIHGFLGSST